MGDKDKVNILLVDDLPGKLLTYEAILQGLDENLVKANSAREAFDRLLRQDFAVVLVDVCMPEMDGFQLASMLREHPRFEKTAVIFVSAIYLNEIDRLKGYENGAVDYMPVPVVPEILRAKVKIFVQLYRQRRELERLNAELEDRVQKRTAEVQAAYARLAESEERLRLASEGAEFGTYDYRLDSSRIHCSDQLKKLLGVRAEGDLAFDDFLACVDPQERDAVGRCIRIAGNGGELSHRIEFRVAQDGGVRWLLDCGRAFFVDEEKKPTRVMGTILDITERKLNEERQLLLMAELDHRVKNILTNVGAIAQLSSRRSTSVDGFVKALDARIQAISKAHNLLWRDGWAGVGLREYLGQLLSPFLNAQGDNIAIQGEPLCLLPKAAQSLALVLHELATNAVKYGALSVPSGMVTISWCRLPERGNGWVRFIWRETGGPAVKEPKANGFGTTMIRTAASEFEGEVDYRFEEGGVAVTIDSRVEQLNKSDRAKPQPPARLVSGAPAILGLLRVFLLEDDAMVALRVKMDLEAAGHRVVALASNADQALALATRVEFDVAFLDIRLGNGLAIPFAEHLYALGIPFAFGSGSEDESVLPRHLREVPRLVKPYAAGGVARLMRSLAAGPDVLSAPRVSAPPVRTS